MSKRFANIERVGEILDEGIEKGLYSGGVVLAGYKGGVIFHHPAGYTDLSRSSPVDKDTLFDIASLTKPIATAPAAMLCVQNGILELRETVPSFFPERSIPYLDNITIFSLLTHTSGLPAWADLYTNSKNSDEAIDKLFALNRQSAPGQKYVYSCLGYMILRLILERVTGEPLDVFCKNHIFAPLQMDSTYFNPPLSRVIASTGRCKWRNRTLCGEVHDSNAYILGGVSGNAGLFSTASDIAKFCSCLIFRSEDGRNQPFGEAVTRKMTRNVLPSDMGAQTMGWFAYPNIMLPAGDLASEYVIGHTGFTGVGVVIDPVYEMYGILLTNRVSVEGDASAFRRLRRRLFNAVFGAIVW